MIIDKRNCTYISITLQLNTYFYLQYIVIDYNNLIWSGIIKKQNKS